jgi:hypothetical protein
MPVRSNVGSRVTVTNSIGPISTATLGVDGTALDTRTIPHASRFVAFANIGTMTEGTLTPSVVDCDTSGGTYTAVTPSDGSFPAITTSNHNAYYAVSFEPNPARPFVKIRMTETVSVTTPVPVSCGFISLPGSGI